MNFFPSFLNIIELVPFCIMVKNNIVISIIVKDRKKDYRKITSTKHPFPDSIISLTIWDVSRTMDEFELRWALSPGTATLRAADSLKERFRLAVIGVKCIA